MDCNAQRIPYRQTNQFSRIVLDYIDQSETLHGFYSQAPTIQGIKNAIAERKQYPTNRALLHAELQKQYAGLATEDEVKRNIGSLLSGKTFTICTAHQPNLFTGPLYFIYKIIHAIRLARDLGSVLPDHHFVPVFFMGSEDADLAELGHAFVDQQKLEWDTRQRGAVGRMKIDESLLALIDSAEGFLDVWPFGPEIIGVFRESYIEGETIQLATFKLLNKLFGRFGLVVLIADTAAFKRQMLPVFRDDLQKQAASPIVEASCSQLAQHYKVQANPREINLFYMTDGLRERIVKKNSTYNILHSELSFSEEEILDELETHPEHFSPNVILRGLFQETILPNLAFAGGGGELAYWLQLKQLFNHYKVPFPVLVLRNSFMLVESKWRERFSKLGLKADDLFMPLQDQVNLLVKRDTQNNVKLNGTLTETEALYNEIKKQAGRIDTTLTQHVEALKATALKRLLALEKKMIRAEKRKFADQQRQLEQIRGKLFPGEGLQERKDNFMYYYARWGARFIDVLLENSPALEHEFVVLEEK